MTEYERTLVRAAKSAIGLLAIDPDNVSPSEGRWIKSYIAGAADDSHVAELYTEAVANDVREARLGIVRELRDVPSAIDWALSDRIAEQLQPFEDAAIEELRTSTAAGDLREMVDHDRAKRQRDLACEARRAGL